MSNFNQWMKINNVNVMLWLYSCSGFAQWKMSCFDKATIELQ